MLHQSVNQKLFTASPAPARPDPAPHVATTWRQLILAGALAAALPVGIAGAADVKALWEKHCTQCHGPDGRGGTKMGKKLKIRDLTDTRVQSEVTDEQMRRNIKEGVKDAAGKVRMKPAENVTDAEIEALVRHVRTLRSK